MTVSKTATADAVRPSRSPRKEAADGTAEGASLQMGELSELLGYSLKRAQLKVFEDFLRKVWRERIEFVKLNIANPAPVPIGPTTVIADNVGFVRPS